LSTLRKTPPVTVSWFLVPDGWDGSGDAVLLGKSALPDMQNGDSVPVKETFSLPKTDFPVGAVLGVIDAEGVTRGASAGAAPASQPLTPAGKALALLGAGYQPPVFDLANVAETLAAGNACETGAGGLDNNFLLISFKPAAADLAVQNLTAPPSPIACDDGQFAVSWTVHATAATPDVPYRVTVTDGAGTRYLRSGSRSFPKGDTPDSDIVTIQTCGVPHTVVVEVNLPAPGSFAESTHSNNRRQVQPYVADSDTGPTGGGSDTVIIVPADCVPNPDATSAYPCVNYPRLKIPGK
jgi:hypothetical protein